MKKPSYSVEGNLIKLKFNNVTKKIEVDKNEKSIPETKGVDKETLKIQGITIHKNKKCNSWYTRYRINGMQKYISAPTQLECYNKLKKELNIIKKEKSAKVIKYTLQSWYEKWLDLFKKDVRESTKRDYRNLYNLVTDKIKNKDLAKIEVLELQENLNSVQAERQRQKLFVFMKAIFEKAKDFNQIKQNPFKFIEKPKHKKMPGKAMLEEEQNLLINYARENNFDWFLILLYQGLRRGELLGLTGNDINFEERSLIINKAWTEKGAEGETKNDYSDRVIPIFDTTLPVLEKYKNYGEKRLFDFGMTTIQRKFKDLLKNAGIINNYKIHDTRHTFITNCKNLNIPEHIIQAWVGHNIGSNVTSRVYTHVTSDKKEQELLSKFYSNSTQKKED